MVEAPGAGTHRVLMRYVVLGVGVTALDVAVTLAAARVMNYLAANTLGFLVANAVQFAIAHTWVFRRALTLAAIRRLYLPTLAVSAVGLAISNVIVYGLVTFGWALLLAKLAASAFGLAFNFALRSRLLYR
jgi:putative flippase GtrA